jgi:hypothetical protein
MKTTLFVTLCFVLGGMSVSVAPAAGPKAPMKENPLKDAYFGETHLHTGVSMDAFIGGNQLTPDDAYRFAKGEEIKVNGSMHKIKRPLDFCAVTDHSEFMGEAYSLMNPGAPGYDDPVAKSFRDATDLETALKLYGKYVLALLASGKDPHPPFYQGAEAIKSTWKKNFEATEKHYQPGKFTTIHAYEYTSAPGAEYYAEGPSGAPDWGIRFAITLLFPKSVGQCCDKPT